MFGKKKTTPTTVSEAIAPFREVQDGLSAVLNKTAERKQEATRRIADAKAYAATVEEDENAFFAEADAEMKQAEKINSALVQILGDDTA